MNKLKTYEEEVSVSFAKMFHDYHSLSPQLLSTVYPGSAPRSHLGKRAHVQAVHQPSPSILGYRFFSGISYVGNHTTVCHSPNPSPLSGLHSLRTIASVYLCPASHTRHISTACLHTLCCFFDSSLHVESWSF